MPNIVEKLTVKLIFTKFRIDFLKSIFLGLNLKTVKFSKGTFN